MRSENRRKKRYWFRNPLYSDPTLANVKLGARGLQHMGCLKWRRISSNKRKVFRGETSPEAPDV